MAKSKLPEPAQKRVANLSTADFELWKKRQYMNGYRAGVKYENERLHLIYKNVASGYKPRSLLLRLALWLNSL